VAGAVLSGAAAILAVAAWLQPDPTGFGTHLQLGRPPCMAILVFGVPCPTCGMTTAFSLAVRGRWWQAFQAQPAGTLLVLGVMVAVLVSITTLITGQVWRLNLYRLPPQRIAYALVAILVISWGFKIVSMRMSG